MNDTQNPLVQIEDYLNSHHQAIIKMQKIIITILRKLEELENKNDRTK